MPVVNAVNFLTSNWKKPPSESKVQKTASTAETISVSLQHHFTLLQRAWLARSHSAFLEGYWPGGRRGCGCVSTLQLWDGVRVGGGGSQTQWHVTGRDTPSCTFTPGELRRTIKTRQQAVLVKSSAQTSKTHFYPFKMYATTDSSAFKAPPAFD